MPRTQRPEIWLGALAVAFSVIGGCGLQQEQAPISRAPVGAQTEALDFFFPRFYNLISQMLGKGLNGRRLNGGDLDGRWVEWASLDEVQLSNGMIEPLTLVGTQLKLDDRRAPRALPWRYLRGAIFNAALDDGSPIRVKIDDIDRGDAPEDRDLLFYTVSYESDDGWLPLCGVDDEGEPITAIPLSGRWDYREGVEGGGDHLDDEGLITFACRGFVLAKCVEMGYRPWVEGRLCEEGSRHRGDCRPYTLADHHQACTRMLRADYCGDGTSYTDDLTLINAYDGIDIRVDSEEWTFEAEWSPEGAVCVGRERLDPPLGPSCWGDLVTDSCGDPDHFEDLSALLMTEVEPL